MCVRQTIQATTLSLALLSGMGGTAMFSAQAETRELNPVAPQAISPSLASYLEKLRSAVAQKDIDALISLSSPEVKLSFGDDAGHEGIRSIFGEPDTKAWDALEEVLGFRFSWDGETAVTPYWFTADPGPNFDPYFTYFVTGEDVLVRSGPSKSSPAIAAVSHDFVMTHDVNTDVSERYVPVELANGLRGYMAEPYLRSEIDFRAGFLQQNGEWKMIFFLAGD